MICVCGERFKKNELETGRVVFQLLNNTSLKLYENEFFHHFFTTVNFFTTFSPQSQSNFTFSPQSIPHRIFLHEDKESRKIVLDSGTVETALSILKMYKFD
jgi:hypothetical protein